MKEQLFNLYYSIKIGQNDTCKNCISNEEYLTRPLSLYFAGSHFDELDNTVLFVGKTAIGGDDFPIVDSLFSDTTKFGELSLDLEEEYATRRAFYSYTNEIIKRHFGTYEEGKKYTALTNIVKCNNTSTEDETSYNLKVHCIDKLGVIWKEIEILKPKRVVFYTARKYDNFIRNYTPINAHEVIDVENNYEDCWWHRRFIDKEQKTICDFLRVYHPERKNKEMYVSKVVNWLDQTQNKLT